MGHPVPKTAIWVHAIFEGLNPSYAYALLYPIINDWLKLIDKPVGRIKS